MTVTYLPNPVVQASASVQQNFEYIESWAVFRDPATGIVVDGAPKTAGPPTTGYWRVGASYIDKNGVLWICISQGSPGIWVTAGGLKVTRKGAIANGGTTTAGWSVIPDMTMTDTFTGAPVIVYFSANMIPNQSPSSYLDTQVWLDGTTPDNSQDWTRTAIPAGISGTTGQAFPFSRIDVFSPSSGAHTVAMAWTDGSGASGGSTWAFRRQMVVVQLPTSLTIH